MASKSVRCAHRPLWQIRRGLNRPPYCLAIQSKYYKTDYRRMLTIDEYVNWLKSEGEHESHLLTKHEPSFNVVAYTGPNRSIKRRVAIHPSTPGWFDDFLYSVRSAHMIQNKIDKPEEQLKYASITLNGKPVTQTSLDELRVNADLTPLQVEFSNRQRRGTWHEIPATDPAAVVRAELAAKMQDAEREANAKRDTEHSAANTQYLDQKRGLFYYGNSSNVSPLTAVASSITADFVSRFLDKSGNSTSATKFELKDTTKSDVFKQALLAVQNKANYASVGAALEPADFWKRCGADNPQLCMSDIANSITNGTVNTELRGTRNRAAAEKLLQTQIVGDGIFKRWYDDLRAMAQRLVHCGTSRYELRGDYGLQYVDPDTQEFSYPVVLQRGERVYEVRRHQTGPLVAVTQAEPDSVNRLYTVMSEAPVDAEARISEKLQLDLIRETARVSDVSSRFKSVRDFPTDAKQTAAPIAAHVLAVVPSMNIIQMSLSGSFNKDPKTQEFTLVTIGEPSQFPDMSVIEQAGDSADQSTIPSIPKLEKRSAVPEVHKRPEQRSATVKPRNRSTITSVAQAASALDQAPKSVTSAVPASSSLSTAQQKATAAVSSNTGFPDLFMTPQSSTTSATVNTPQQVRRSAPIASLLMCLAGNDFEKQLVHHLQSDDQNVRIYPTDSDGLQQSASDMNHYVFPGFSNYSMVKSLIDRDVDECRVTNAANVAWDLKRNDAGNVQARVSGSSMWHDLTPICVVENPSPLSFRVQTPHHKM